MAQQVAVLPAVSAAVVTPSDLEANNFVTPTMGIWIGGLGTVAVVFEPNTAVSFVAVPAGTFLPVRAVRVNATGTTATNIVAMFNRA